MKEFFLILFFGKVVLLTPNPVDLYGELAIIPDEPITAVTSGATILVDVSSMVERGEDEGLVSRRQRLREMFPSGSITAKLSDGDKSPILLRYSGHTSISDNRVRLLLGADSGIPTGREFSRVVISSKIELENVQIFWKNFEQ